MNPHNYRHLVEWTLPPSYFGATWEGWAPVIGQHRDSYALDRSNYAQVHEALNCRPWDSSDTSDIPAEWDAVDTRCNHWAVGWCETIYVRLGSPAADVADELLEALEDYPVLNDEHYSELEWDEASEYWQNMSRAERVDICQRFGVSVFAARRDEIPRDENMLYVHELARHDW